MGPIICINPNAQQLNPAAVSHRLSLQIEHDEHAFALPFDSAIMMPTSHATGMSYLLEALCNAAPYFSHAATNGSIRAASTHTGSCPLTSTCPEFKFS